MTSHASSTNEEAEPEREAVLGDIERMLAAGDKDAVLTWVGGLLAQGDQMKLELRRRELVIKHLTRLYLGRRSEKLTRDELAQLVLAYGGTPEQAANEDPTLPTPEPADAEPEETPKGKTGRRRNHPGRTKLSPDLERVVKFVAVPADERDCTLCGAEMECFGYVDHESIEYVPARFVVHVTRCEKWGCKACRGDAMTAEREEPPVKTRAGASVLAHLIESKCDDALPIDRQRDQFARLGFDVPLNTLYGWWKYATELLQPVSDAVLGVVLDDPVCVSLDDTGIDVLDQASPKGKYRAHLWCFRGKTRPLVAFAFTETWEANEIESWIGAIAETAYIQVDDYGGYSALVENPEGGEMPLVPLDRRIGCGMHIRRRFYAAWKAGDRRAAFAVETFRRIYEIEDEIRGKSPDERLAVRRERSLPLLDELDEQIDRIEPRLGKSGLFEEAVRYSKNQRVFFRRCFEDGRLEIDNGDVEREIREPAMGRRNFLFTGSAAAGKRLAAAYTLVQSCRALGISTREYLIDVIEKLGRGWPARRLIDLLPHNWAAARQAQATADAPVEPLPEA